tara:strand:- start:2699 stop:3043 length:345 start_codon:yes stop_codon:yes gene_type:complete
MSKLLQGRLPFVTGNQSVDGATFNRAVRLLEISLGAFDPDATPQFTSLERDVLKFDAGSLIWNPSVGQLQYFDGTEWRVISARSLAEENPLQAEGKVGSVQVLTNGDVVVAVTG